MAFSKKTWIDRLSEFPNRRQLNPTGTANVYDVQRAEGLVTKDGDPFNAATMNDLENRIDAGLSGMVADGMPKSGGTFTGVVVAQNNASYTTKQIRNVTISSGAPSGGANGDLWFQYV